MIDRSHALPLARQAEELGISRGSLYYQPEPVSSADLALMRRMDEPHLELRGHTRTPAFLKPSNKSSRFLGLR
jgi:hypothetical protein